MVDSTMTPTFYNRYAPQPAAEQWEGSPPKKRRLAQARVSELDRDQKAKDNRRHTQDRQKPSQKILERVEAKTAKRKTDKSILQEGDSESIHTENTHQKIRAKYKKSIENATSIPAVEKLSRFEPDENSTSEDQHGLEPLPQPTSVDTSNTLPDDAGLPDWIRRPTVSHGGRHNFQDFNLSEKVVKLLHKTKITETTIIQSAVLPLLLPGPAQHHGDLCVSASTGSGKTIAYALPLIESFRDKVGPRLRGLIVVPTRELVNQGRDVLQTYCAGSGIKIGVAVGSRSLKEERKSLLRSRWVFDPEAHRAWRDKPADDLDELMKWDTESSDDYEEGPPEYVKRYFSAIDILVCTPGRLVDHIRNTKHFHLHDVDFLVIDEADRLLDESFQEWLDIVLPELNYLPPIDKFTEDLRWTLRIPPRRRNVRKVIVSATMTKDVGKLAGLQLQNPRLVVSSTTQTRATKDNDDEESKMANGSALFQIPPKLAEYASQGINNQDKPLYLLELLNKHMARRQQKAPSIRSASSSSSSTSIASSTEASDDSNSQSGSSTTPDGPPSRQKPSDDVQTDPRQSQQLKGILIFANSNEAANRLSRLIEILRPELAPSLFTLTKSSRSSTQRKALKALQTREIIIIATDRASRGLDIPNLSCVINYEMPKSVKIYVHRVGRTARAGSSGTAYTLVADNEPGWFWNVIAKGGQIERADKVERMTLRPGGWNIEEKNAYNEALHTLGEDVKGH